MTNLHSSASKIYKKLANGGPSMAYVGDDGEKIVCAYDSCDGRQLASFHPSELLACQGPDLPAMLAYGSCLLGKGAHTAMQSLAELIQAGIDAHDPAATGDSTCTALELAQANGCISLSLPLAFEINDFLSRLAMGDAGDNGHDVSEALGTCEGWHPKAPMLNVANDTSLFIWVLGTYEDCMAVVETYAGNQRRPFVIHVQNTPAMAW